MDLKKVDEIKQSVNICYQITPAMELSRLVRNCYGREET